MTPTRTLSSSPDVGNSKETGFSEKREHVSHYEHAQRSNQSSTDGLAESINAKLANPLAGISHEQLMMDGAAFAKSHELGEHIELFQKGALVAQDPLNFDQLSILTSEDKEALRSELSNNGSNQKCYIIWLFCVQMDETVINGANLFYPQQFGIDPNSPTNGDRNQWLMGLVGSAPYLCCAVLGCWLTDPLNRYLGRRGTIFVTATFSFLTCIWQGVTNSWQHLFVARFFLGIGIGPKSSTVPVYAAECSPPAIRGALVMMWQTWTAFGIMLGFVSDLIFFRVPNKPHITGLNWRLMLASAGMPALLIMTQVFFCPESPRWYISKGRYAKAYDSLLSLRNHPLQAARDLYYMHVLLEEEKKIQRSRNRFLELFTVPRNRRATLASFIVMFLQQFCGVNVIAYYSSTIFSQANFNETQALLASFGFGAINFIFAFPAIYTIDTFGRRNLLLTTFPLMAIFLLMTGFAFWIPEDNKAHLAVVALGIYLFGMAYSPGEGPVPFTYSAEAFPLYVRDIGMSSATAVLWFFNFVISITFPRLLGAFKPQGVFGWYAAWNIIGFFAVLLFVPETKALSLEELDQVFSVPTHIHATYQLKSLAWKIRKYVFRRKERDFPPLYSHEGALSDAKV